MKLIIKEEKCETDFRPGKPVKQKMKKTDKQRVSCTVGKVITFEKGKQSFEITEVTDDTVGFIAVYAEERYNKQWKLKKGESTLYHPAARDGGYRYLFILK